ncbi:MAG TPA: kelch repeat-containing protein [Chthoniobacterales bacterium]|jgi:N-acetylneuraminic acid mutarotase|nr:kelch repeat-containing protein [Chthoniobacterales bacterium]
MQKFLAGLISSFLFAAEASGQTGGGEWKVLSDMPTPRQELATAVLNGKIYTLGGYDADVRATKTVEVYNPATNSWTTAADLLTGNQHNAAAVAAGKLYSFGGLARSTAVYDPVTNTWAAVATMNVAHSNTAAVGVINDLIYVAGGTPDGTAVEVFDPATNIWTMRAPMKVGRNHCAGGVINGKFYVAAGRGSTGAATALEVYDPQTNNWTTLASMPTPRSGVAAGVVNGELYVFGGEVGGVHPEVEVYNPGTNSWRRVQDMVVPRHGIWASVIGNKIYIPGGGVAENFLPTARNDAFVVTSPATFANIATRLKVGTGDNALIGGFIVAGAGPKRIILRAIGPSVPLNGTLSNPTLELYNQAGQLIAANDNWQEAANKQEITDSSLAPKHTLEAAILRTVTPGSYTAVVRGADNSTGIALVEVYDLEAGSDSRLANISTRGFVETLENVLIGGVIFDGQLPRRVLVRAIGPSLGRSDSLADPTLELRDANGGLRAANDNWRSRQETEINATTIPPAHDAESALVETLEPAAYTAIVRGVNDGTGIAVVEAYALD